MFVSFDFKGLLMFLIAKFKSGNNSGFSLIEVIAILMLIGVVSVFAITKLSSIDSYSVITEADIVKNHLRFVHLRAMTDEVPWGIFFSAGSYTLLKNGVTANINLPNESSAIHSLRSGVTITTGAGTTISFDNWGSPGNTNKVIILSGTETITVTKNTGFIQ